MESDFYNILILSSSTVVAVDFGTKKAEASDTTHCVSLLVHTYPSCSLLKPKNGFVLLEEGSKHDGAVETLRAIPHV